MNSKHRQEHSQFNISYNNTLHW